MKLKNLDLLVKVVTQALLDNDEKVMHYFADGHYLLSKEGVSEVVRKALEDA